MWRLRKTLTYLLTYLHRTDPEIDRVAELAGGLVVRAPQPLSFRHIGSARVHSAIVGTPDTN